MNGREGYGPYLHIENDQELRDLHIHYSSALKTAKGFERLVGLEYLYLRENQIVQLNIRGLEKLNYLWVHNNKIRDLSGAEYMKVKGCCKDRYEIDDQKQPSQEETDEARLW
ncbi:Leucine-rich_repeat domain superfamily [Hexamita inflata]|uniref:Leucine-rich repeat domain superfamily n=1 Tax=Hexamita inflata TaxID=28002 RepID=A0AA86U8M7_9EUKA|nr:Leucine-rich repeat domain superfamily [Hexamita inflata]